ncbi:MAG: hypothetical protein IJM46_12430 [Oscillospiraceae bacterium]|nr:hypothetical protein [Oscillospiraceae bacterium]
MKKAVCIAALTSVMLGLSGCTVYFGDSAANINIADTPYTAETGISGSSSAVTETAAASAAQTAAQTTVSAAATAVQTTAAITATSAATAAPATTAPAAATVQTTPAVTAAATAETVPAEKKAVWKTLYQETLMNYKERDDISFDAKWDLQDIDQDGIPELLISQGPYHASGVEIYYYENNSVSPVLFDDGTQLYIGSYGETLICPEEHLFGFEDIQMGYHTVAMNRYEQHRLKEILHMVEDSGMVGDENVTYTVDGATVTEAVFTEKLKLFNGKKWKAVGAKYSLDDFSALN